MCDVMTVTEQEEERRRVADNVVKQKLIDALQMAKHIVEREGSTAELYQIFDALEAAGVKP